MDFSLDQIQALDAVDRLGSFAAAAEEMHRVPSAISYLIKGLEDALGVQVFDRSRRSATLTPAGQRVLQKGREVLERARGLDAMALELRSGWEPELQVVVDGALPMAALIRCLKAFASDDVPTRLRLDVEYQEGVLDRFEADRAHLALALGLDANDGSLGYELKPLPTLDFALVLSPEHALAGRPVTREEMRGGTELVVRDSSPRYLRSPKGSFLGTPNVVYLSDFHSKRLALLAGAGFGWVPRHLVADDLEAGTLVLMQEEGPAEWTYEPVLVRHADHPPGRGERLFLDALLG